MAFDLKELAKKLKRYREQFQTSIEELSEATGIDPNSLKAYEVGSQKPNGDEILILADFYKCDYKFFISNERIAPFDQTDTLFRIHGNELSKNDRWAIQEFLYLCECETFLQENLGNYQTVDFSFQKSGNYFKKHGKDAAYSLRSKLNYSEKEIPSDVFRDFRKIGIHVFRRKLENSRISGLFVNHPIAQKCILVNYSEDIYRQRFTASHEAGHAIFDAEEDVIVSFTKWKSNDLIEIRANTFASHYLLPESALRLIPNLTEWNSEKAAVWAKKLMVSTSALAIALSTANLIDKKMLQIIKSAKIPREAKHDPELSGSLSSRARKRKEQLLKRGLSSYYVNLCLNAYRQNIITAARMAEMLLINENELQGIAELFDESIDYAS